MTDLDKGIFGTAVTQVGSKGKAETDVYRICDSKHEVWIYTTDFGNDGVVTPGADNIVVSFVGTDSAGVGCIGDIVSGAFTLITDPVEWITTVGSGLAHEDSWIGTGSYVGDAAVDSGATNVIIGVGGAILDIPSNAGKIWDSFWDDEDDYCYITTAVMNSEGQDNSPELKSMRHLRDRFVNWFAAEEVNNYYKTAPRIVAGINRQPQKREIYHHLHSEFIVPAHKQVTQGNYGSAYKIYKNMVNYTRRFASVEDLLDECLDDVGGTVFHNNNGRGHKINIYITCDGESMYDTELAGTSDRTTTGSAIRFNPTLKQFKITKPGTWIVTVKSLASHAECGTPALDKSWTINVPKPADWDESAPTIETQTEEVKEVTAQVGKQLELVGFNKDVDPLTVFAGIAIGGGLLVWGVLRLLTSKSSDKDPE
jgi:hypothetical protein